jgi:hypothetical protein
VGGTEEEEEEEEEEGGGGGGGDNIMNGVVLNLLSIGVIEHRRFWWET